MTVLCAAADSRVLKYENVWIFFIYTDIFAKKNPSDIVADKRCVSETGRPVDEFMKPAAYSVTEQSFPGIVSTSSPVHHLYLRDVAPKLSYQLYNQTALSSPSAADNLRSTDGHVRFFDGRLQDGNAVRSGGDLTGTAHRMLPELCYPVSSDDVVCMARLSLTTPSSILWARCLRGQTPHHFQSAVDDLLPSSVTAVVVSPESLMSKYSHDWSRILCHPRSSSLDSRRWSRGDFWVRIIPTLLQGYLWDLCSTNWKFWVHLIRTWLVC